MFIPKAFCFSLILRNSGGGRNSVKLIFCHLRSLKSIDSILSSLKFENDYWPGKLVLLRRTKSKRQRALTSRHLSSIGEGGGEGPEEGGGLPRLPGDALHVELQDLQAP